MAAATFNETKQAGQRPEASAKIGDAEVRLNIIRQGSPKAEPRTGLFSCVAPKVSTRVEIASFVLTDGIEQNLQKGLPFETDKHPYIRTRISYNEMFAIITFSVTLH